MPFSLAAGHLLFYTLKVLSPAGILVAIKNYYVRKGECFSCRCTHHPLQNSTAKRFTNDAMKWVISSWAKDDIAPIPVWQGRAPARPHPPARQFRFGKGALPRERRMVILPRGITIYPLYLSCTITTKIHEPSGKHPPGTSGRQLLRKKRRGSSPRNPDSSGKCTRLQWHRRDPRRGSAACGLCLFRRHRRAGFQGTLQGHLRHCDCNWP